MIEICRDLITKWNPLFKKSAAWNFRWGRNNIFIKRQLNVLQDRLITSIEDFKQKYYCGMTNKLINTQKSSKTSWSSLKGLLSNKSTISPLFHENYFISCCYSTVPSANLFHKPLNKRNNSKIWETLHKASCLIAKCLLTGWDQI